LAFRELERAHGSLPETLTARTGGGGEHRYLSAISALRSGTLAPGVEVKGEGGYVILPPSLHPMGTRYEWDSGCTPGLVADPPAWLLAQLAPAREGGSEFVVHASTIPVGSRNVTLTSLAGAMRQYGMTREAIAAALHAENRARCEAQLPSDEVERIATSVARYAPSAALVVAGRMLSAHLGVGVRAESNFRFRTAAEIAQETSERPEFLIHGYVAPGAVTELVGKAKAAGKTTFVLHGIRRVLDGLPFLGTPTTRAPVVYLTEERPGTFREGLRRADLLGREDLHVLYWLETIGCPWPEVAAAAVAECQRVGARLLVVDTVSQFGGLRGDAENSAGEALLVLQPLQEAAAAGLAVVAIRHERKGGGEIGESGRGSSAFEGGVDIVVALRRAEGNAPSRRVLYGLSRFDETPDELAIELTDMGYVSLGALSDVAAQDAERAILDLFPRTEAEALRLDDILAAAPTQKRATVQRVITRKSEQGVIARVGAGRRGDPYRYWRREPGARPGDGDATSVIHSAQTPTLNGQNESPTRPLGSNVAPGDDVSLDNLVAGHVPLPVDDACGADVLNGARLCEDTCRKQDMADEAAGPDCARPRGRLCTAPHCSEQNCTPSDERGAKSNRGVGS
jgi:hypothetical protein